MTLKEQWIIFRIFGYNEVEFMCRFDFELQALEELKRLNNIDGTIHFLQKVTVCE